MIKSSLMYFYFFLNKISGYTYGSKYLSRGACLRKLFYLGSASGEIIQCNVFKCYAFLCAWANDL